MITEDVPDVDIIELGGPKLLCLPSVLNVVIDLKVIKMRDKKRIDKILDKLREEWKENPDWRFNQLLINLGLIPDGPHWHLEDDKILEQLEEIEND